MPHAISTIFWCPKKSRTVPNVGVPLTKLSTPARLVVRRPPCHALRSPQPPQAWARARAVPPPISIIMGIVRCMSYKTLPTHYARIPAKPHCTPLQAPTSPYTLRTPSHYLRYPLIRPHKQYSARPLVPNLHWSPQARQDLHLQQRALDMSFVLCASKRLASITHCLAVWTAQHCQHPKNLQLPVGAPLSGKEIYDTRSYSRCGASTVGRTLVIASPSVFHVLVS